MDRSFAESRAHEPQRKTAGAADRSSDTSPAHRWLHHLQRTAGNRAVARLLGGEEPASWSAADRSAGRSLDETTRVSMESRLGQDFSEVRLHAGPVAAQVARQQNAQAFTVGEDVVLAGPGETARARTLLLAHELVHVIQQRRGGVGGGPAHEAEAAAVAHGVASGRTPAVTLGAEPGSVQCQEPPSGAPKPPAWLSGVTARHVQGNIWEVDFSVGGPHYVGPYDELTAFVKKAGLIADAHHIVGGEHLQDLESSFTYQKAPAVAIEPGLHEKVITPRIGAEQAAVGGRRGGRATLGPEEVASMYRAAYSEQAPFGELANIAGNIVRQSATVKGSLPAATKPTPAATTHPAPEHAPAPAATKTPAAPLEHASGTPEHAPVTTAKPPISHVPDIAEHAQGTRTGRSPVGEGWGLAAAAAGAAAADFIVFIGVQYLQEEQDERNEGRRRAELAQLQPEIERRLARLPDEARKLQAAGKRAFANLTLLETYQSDEEGLTFFGGLRLIDLKISDQDIQDSFQTQLRPSGLWEAVKGFLQFSIGHATYRNTFSWELPNVDPVVERRPVIYGPPAPPRIYGPPAPAPQQR
jgi:hypothetical protein